MLYLILALVALGVISAVFGIISHRKGEDEEPLHRKKPNDRETATTIIKNRGRSKEQK